MKILARSPFSGKINCMDIPNLTEAQLDAYEQGSKPIQVALSHLTPDEREFIMTGITPEEFPEEER